MTTDPGYIVELAEGGPWLAQDGKVAVTWHCRGIWPTGAEAYRALFASRHNPEVKRDLANPGQPAPVPQHVTATGAGS